MQSLFDLGFDTVEPIDKGWSNDRKFRVTRDGAAYLLRLSPAGQEEKCRAVFEHARRAESLGIPMSRAVETGPCRDGLYTLFTWIDGQDAETAVPRLPAGEQYALGVRAGQILRRIHTLPAPAGQEDWAFRFGRKMDVKIQRYLECPLRFDGDSRVIDYIERSRGLIRGRPQCFQHGDYHIGNLMLQDGGPVVIDFDRYDFGDPWEEFNRIVWCAQASPQFARGRIDGYFDGPPPKDFFPLLALYIASNTLSSIYWAIPFGQGQVDVMMRQAREVLGWFDQMRSPVPAWYGKSPD